MRLVKLRRRKVTKLPLQIVLPEEFVRVNRVMPDDIIEIYISDTGELIIKIKKEE